MNNLVTVVVTCYNHQQFIEQCIRSIYTQTYSNIQLIIINDGSTDESEKIIKEVLLESPFPLTEYVYQENMGLCVARNNSFDRIRGEFVLFVDSDNFLDENYIQKLLENAIENNADIVYGNLFNPDTNQVFMKSKSFDLNSYLLGNYIDSCSLVKMSMIGDTRYDIELNRKKLEDYDFFLNLIVNKNAKPFYVSEVNLNYRVIDNSISRRDDEKFYFEVYLYVLKKYVSELPVKVFNAIKEQFFILLSRHQELENHTFKVADYVHFLESKNKMLFDQSAKYENEVSELIIANETISAKLFEVEKERDQLEIEKDYFKNSEKALLSSVSYRLGHNLVWPIKKLLTLIRHPKRILAFLKKTNIERKKISGALTKVKGLFLAKFRKYNRNKNNYINPRRTLLYVIYEENESLQEYKEIFLSSLAPMCKNVLIVVNGSLSNDDEKKLRNYGKVIVRENIGYDVAAFRYGIQELKKDILNQSDELLLVNDTNIGPIFDLESTFEKMSNEKLDFWGISYGEQQTDITGYNPYGYIPEHLQSYFIVVEKSMFNSKYFYKYWNGLSDTSSRNKAIGKHETVFTKYFSDKGFVHGAVARDSSDSAMYIHPLKMLKENVPIIKYSALNNYDNKQFLWQGLVRETEVPSLIEYIKLNTDFPARIVEDIVDKFKCENLNKFILIIDGVEGVIPQCTRYRVLNKAEQLQNLGFEVNIVNRSDFHMEDAKYASHIIIYRCPVSDEMVNLCKLARKCNKSVLFDIDDLVIDTKYTDQLSYTKSLSQKEKNNYDANVNSYNSMMNFCDGIITSTGTMESELRSYKKLVMLNRNLASEELVKISQIAVQEANRNDSKIKIGYFSGSITHNENFELIMPALLRLLETYSNVELHLIGYLDLPKKLSNFKNQIRQHEYVEWHELPTLIQQVDINLAPLVNSLFNRAKSEIKWIEAALVKVPTMASNIGAFAEMISDGKNGVLVEDEEWFEKLSQIVLNKEYRVTLGENAYNEVLQNNTTSNHSDDLIKFLKNN